MKSKPMNPLNKPLTAFALISLLSGITLLSGCATNDELFAKYDKSCDLPPATVKIIEKVTYKDKVVYQDKLVKMDGMAWEPAVYFGFDLASLSAEEAQRLATDVAILKKNPNVKVNLQSFTDYKGSKTYNKRLAKRRQATVVDYLKTMGIAANRITVSPLGEELPLLGKSKQDRVINRRVELMLLDQSGRPLAIKLQQNASAFTPPLPVK